MRGLNLKEIMSKSNMNQQGLNIATYGQAYCQATNVEFIVDPKVLFRGWLIYSYLHLSWSSDYQESVQIGSLTTKHYETIRLLE